VPGLGRLIAKDPRDHQFRLAAHPLASAVVSRKSKTWSIFVKPLDQGNTGTCVAHAWKGRLLAAPVIHRQTEEPSPFQLYDECIKLDEWTENDVDPDRQYGTSVRAGAKALVARGLISEYRWTDQVDEAADWISGVDSEGNFVGGPVVIGVNFYYSMFTLDTGGYMRIEPDTTLAGGHCMLLIGWDQKRGRFRGLNSWSSSWGQNGRFWLDGETAQRLFSENGEVCIPTESTRR
jgi:hypothetical protein